MFCGKGGGRTSALFTDQRVTAKKMATLSKRKRGRGDLSFWMCLFSRPRKKERMEKGKKSLSTTTRGGGGGGGREKRKWDVFLALQRGKKGVHLMVQKETPARRAANSVISVEDKKKGKEEESISNWGWKRKEVFLFTLRRGSPRRKKENSGLLYAEGKNKKALYSGEGNKFR